MNVKFYCSQCYADNADLIQNDRTHKITMQSGEQYTTICKGTLEQFVSIASLNDVLEICKIILNCYPDIRPELISQLRSELQTFIWEGL